MTLRKVNMSGEIGDGFLWFRCWGRGLGFYDRSKRRAPYSERVGAVKVWRVGKWAIKPFGRGGNG